MLSVLAARFIVGAVLALSPVLCMAQEEPGASSGATTVTVDSGSLLLERLDTVAEGAVALKDLATPEKARAAWASEVQRYAERSGELRTRCHEEIRKANRDTIVSKSAQCLRSDLLLEITHRRKQADMFADLAGVDATVAEAVSIGVAAYVSAANAVVDGVDTGVFSTVDMLGQAKRNLDDTYRKPMLRTFARARASRAAALTRSLAASVQTALDGDVRRPFIDAFVPCVELAHDTLMTATNPASDVTEKYAAGITELRRCADMADDEKED
jgi:hypothetical protein